MTLTVLKTIRPEKHDSGQLHSTCSTGDFIGLVMNRYAGMS